MKKLLSIVALLSFVGMALLAGCKPADNQPPPSEKPTNAPPPSTNK